MGALYLYRSVQAAVLRDLDDAIYRPGSPHPRDKAALRHAHVREAVHHR
ncbi:hypothetical protein KK062_22140 [Fulvivirgaceae bacterium PWU5]|uniref:Uncharacterized protein n=1 Tax=Dawidia cretensis TaxID=2782350 RepID=A0AAP2E3M7_9BACT|nr:hypothetical protein [Dawidia cretensis]MBT1710959.1 hypothetical protein [Dawidia cretensis]